MESINSSDLNLIRQMLDLKMRESYKGSEESYTLWFSRMQLRELSNDKASFVCENEMKRGIISDRFLSFISDCLTAVLGYETEVEIGVDTSLAPVITNDDNVISPLEIIRKQEEKEARRNEEFEAEFDEASETGERRLRYNEDYTFENFVVGNFCACSRTERREQPERKGLDRCKPALYLGSVRTR